MEKDLKKIAEDVFKRYPRQNKVYVTTDGQSFFDEHHAKNHATSNRTGAELKVETFLRDGEMGQTAGGVKNSKELIAEIKETAALEAVEAILTAEKAKASESRKTVIDACEKRIAELTKTTE